MNAWRRVSWPACAKPAMTSSTSLKLAPAETDTEVIRRARDEDRLLLTEDKDFGELVFRRARQVPGIVMLRIDPARQNLQWPRVQDAVAKLGERLFGHYTVIEESRLRSRPLLRSIP